jgi:hypothetical protein
VKADQHIQPANAINQFAVAFRRSGFGVVRGALDAGRVQEMRMLLRHALCAQRNIAEDPLEVQLPRIVEVRPEFLALATAPPLITMLTELFGTVPHLVASYGHSKPARTSAHTGVHSDIVHLHGVPHHDSTVMVKVMYALTPVGPGSGATLVYPGSHRLPAAEQTCRGPKRALALLLEPGDVQIFHANLLHTATANPSPLPRLSLWFVYAQPWMRVFPGHEYTTAFLATMGSRLESDPVLASVFGLPDPYSTRV